MPRLFALFLFVITFGAHAQLELEPITTVSGTVSIDSAGDQRLFFTQKGGNIRIFDGTQVLPTPFLNISGLVSGGSEQGLLSMAFHPDYANNGFFFVNYTNLAGDTIIARYQVSAGDPNVANPAGTTLLNIDQTQANHNGGQIQFGPDGYLYIGMGDGGGSGDPGCHAQNPQDMLGKMLRIDVDQNVNTPPFHGIPADNPFVGDPTTLDEIWATGLRNPWRFSFDRLTGEMYIADVGQNQWEEVSRQPAASPGGENYGWDVMEGFHCFQDDPSCPANTPPCMDASLTDPIFEYVHTAGRCSITGGYVYRGCLAPELIGKYIYADFCTGEIWSAFEESPGNWTIELLFNLTNIATFGEDEQGELYVGNNGEILRFTGSDLETYIEIWGTFPAAPCFTEAVNILDILPHIN